MKRSKKIFSALLALVMILAMAVSASAAWPVYGGGANHNAVITGAPTSPTQTSLTQYVDLPHSGSGWDGVDNVPIMRTVGGTTYAYVLYDGYGYGGSLAKVDCGGRKVVWRKQIESGSGFQLSTPLLVEGGTEATDVIYAASNSGSVYKVTGLNSTSASGVTATKLYTVTDGGQINTPITKYGDYIYFGTWVGNGTVEGSENIGHYHQLDTTTNAVQRIASTYKGFYWAGAVKSGDYIYFGGDNGKLYSCKAGSTFAATRKVFDLNGGDTGNVRSTIMTDGNGKLYFTSQSGYLWSYNAGNTGTPTFNWKAKLGGTSTSTPTLLGNRVYVGYYSGFSAGGVQYVDITDTTRTAKTVTSGFPVQSSILAQGTGADSDYLYFVTNADDGAGYCYQANGTKVWASAGDTYALGGMAYDSGYIVFGNDYDHFYIVK